MAFGWMALRAATTDLMVFAGVDSAQAAHAVSQSVEEPRIPAPPAAVRMPFSRRLR